MKFSAVFTSAFAVLAAASPAPMAQRREVSNSSEPRRQPYVQTDFNYLQNLNGVDLALLQSLNSHNNLDIVVFQDVFRTQVFSLDALLQFQQLNTLLAIASTGIFNTFDLSTLPLGSLNLGLIQGIGGFDLGQLIEASIRPQVEIVAKEVTTTIIIAKK